jgi:glycosyltransferase involved in cell wall biosynthesis
MIRATTNDASTKVTYIVVSYNHRQFLEQSIRSACGQTHPNVDVVVCDDASTDGSGARIEELQQELGFDFRPNSSNQGFQKTLTGALEHAVGDYVGFVAADDVLAPNKVERQLEYMTSERLDAVYGPVRVIDSQGAVISEPDYSRVADWFRTGKYLQHAYVDDTEIVLSQSGLFRREVLAGAGAIRDRFWLDDWPLTLFVLQRFRVGFLNERLCSYRSHTGNIHKDYWRMLPRRLQVVAEMTPPHLRRRAISNLVLSLAQYVTDDGQPLEGMRYLIAGLALGPSARNGVRSIPLLARSLLRRLRGSTRG